ncbi:MAG TPA: hypothetical protein VD948_02735 [Rhodothermales bacterium]|nr:hypothetical protein [Rhodothermales bacterium]
MNARIRKKHAKVGPVQSRRRRARLFWRYVYRRGSFRWGDRMYIRVLAAGRDTRITCEIRFAVVAETPLDQLAALGARPTATKEPSRG